MLGALRAGKSELLHRAVDDRFDPAYRQTLGADMLAKEMFTEDGERVTLELWSCGGHDRFIPITQQLFAGTNAACLVYDVTSASSLERCVFWRNEALRVFPEAVLVLVGTKCDLVDDVQVSEDDGRSQAEHWSVPHALVSAKTGDRVEELFTTLLGALASQG